MLNRRMFMGGGGGASKNPPFSSSKSSKSFTDFVRSKFSHAKNLEENGQNEGKMEEIGQMPILSDEESRRKFLKILLFNDFLSKICFAFINFLINFFKFRFQYDEERSRKRKRHNEWTFGRSSSTIHYRNPNSNCQKCGKWRRKRNWGLNYIFFNF